MPTSATDTLLCRFSDIGDDTRSFLLLVQVFMFSLTDCVVPSPLLPAVLACHFNLITTLFPSSSLQLPEPCSEGLHIRLQYDLLQVPGDVSSFDNLLSRCTLKSGGLF